MLFHVNSMGEKKECRHKKMTNRKAHIIKFIMKCSMPSVWASNNHNDKYVCW